MNESQAIAILLTGACIGYLVAQKLREQSDSQRDLRQSLFNLEDRIRDLEPKDPEPEAAAT